MKKIVPSFSISETKDGLLLSASIAAPFGWEGDRDFTLTANKSLCGREGSFAHYSLSNSLYNLFSLLRDSDVLGLEGAMLEWDDCLAAANAVLEPFAMDEDYESVLSGIAAAKRNSLQRTDAVSIGLIAAEVDLSEEEVSSLVEDLVEMGHVTREGPHGMMVRTKA
jgi:hypothetical protein